MGTDARDHITILFQARALEPADVVMTSTTIGVGAVLTDKVLTEVLEGIATSRVKIEPSE